MQMAGYGALNEAVFHLWVSRKVIFPSECLMRDNLAEKADLVTRCWQRPTNRGVAVRDRPIVVLLAETEQSWCCRQRPINTMFRNMFHNTLRTDMNLPGTGAGTGILTRGISVRRWPGNSRQGRLASGPAAGRFSKYSAWTDRRTLGLAPRRQEYENTRVRVRKMGLEPLKTLGQPLENTLKKF